MFDKETLDLYVDKGLVNVQKHPTAELYLYNYSATTQYERVWDEVTTACRGLILDENQNIIARPFPKFFNLDEHSRSDLMFSKPFTVFEKVDGSLGIFYKMPGEEDWRIATRGSFTSDQALWATALYKQKYASRWNPALGYTTLVEIIYPANRIVVDYKGMEDLVLITTINNVDGRDLPEAFYPGPRVKRYKTDGIKPRDVLESMGFEDDGDKEGIVIVFDYPKTGPKARVKVKLEEYKRLHRILTGVSTKTIWENLRTNQSMSEILEKVPDEFYDWVDGTIRDLNERYDGMLMRIQDTFDLLISKFAPPNVPEGARVGYARANRAEFAALNIKNGSYVPFVFNLLDGKPIDDKVWMSIKPEYTRPFTKDIDT